MGKPLLLLDVDGPLNVWAASNSKTPKGYRTHRMSPRGWTGPPLKVRLWPAHGPMLLDFAETHSVELVWATTWEDQANTMIGPEIGLPELPVIDFGGQQPGRLHGWKYPDVSAYAHDRALAWFDDDFGAPEYAEAQARFLRWRAGHAATLLHHVDPTVGITQADLDAVAEWVKAL